MKKTPPPGRLKRNHAYQADRGAKRWAASSEVASAELRDDYRTVNANRSVVAPT